MKNSTVITKLQMILKKKIKLYTKSNFNHKITQIQTLNINYKSDLNLILLVRVCF
jgi:hypothetical protein